MDYVKSCLLPTDLRRASWFGKCQCPSRAVGQLYWDILATERPSRMLWKPLPNSGTLSVHTTRAVFWPNKPGNLAPTDSQAWAVEERVLFVRALLFLHYQSCVVHNTPNRAFRSLRLVIDCLYAWFRNGGRGRHCVEDTEATQGCFR